MNETSRTLSGQPVVHRLSEEAGISGNEWAPTKLLTDSAGYVWMIFSNKLYCFEPRLVQFNSTPPSVSIEDIRLNLQPTRWKTWADTLYGYRQLPRQSKLPYYLNNLSISYKAPCFSGPSGIEYSWQLEGVDSGWSAPIKNTSVAFVKLPPGTYCFKVKV